MLLNFFKERVVRNARREMGEDYRYHITPNCNC